MFKEPRWLNYAKKLQAIAQAGIAYSKDKYDIERYKQISRMSVDILNNYTNMEHKRIEELFANETGYPTPKVDVRAAIFKDNKILLVKQKVDGLWALPGGWADVDLSLKENLIKEAKEEAGVDIKPKRIIAILDRKKHNKPPMPYGVYKIFVECTYINMNFKTNIETSNAEFFSEDNLPPLSTRRNTKEQLKMCFKATENEFHETIFD